MYKEMMQNSVVSNCDLSRQPAQGTSADHVLHDRTDCLQRWETVTVLPPPQMPGTPTNPGELLGLPVIPRQRRGSFGSIQDGVYTIPLHIERVGNNINRVLTTAPAVHKFDQCSLLSTLISIGSHIADMGTDIAVAYLLRREKDTQWWFWLTVTLIIIPSMIVNAFSLYWYWQDEKLDKKKYPHEVKRPPASRPVWIYRIIMHILLIGNVARHIDVIRYGLKSRKSDKGREAIEGPYCTPHSRENSGQMVKSSAERIDYYSLMVNEERDTTLLDLMDIFLQDAPQLVLQLYILAKRPIYAKNDLQVLTTIVMQSGSATISLVSLSWSLVSHHRALRYSIFEKPNLSPAGTALQFLWRICMVGARVIVIALFGTVYRLELFLLCGAHWAVMSLWIILQDTNFCGSADGKRRPCEETLYNVVIGWVYIFCFFNVKDEPTRFKYIFFYIIMLAENTTMIVMWYLYVKEHDEILPWYHTPSISAVLAAFFMGLVFLILYYRKFHPEGRMPNRNAKATLF